MRQTNVRGNLSLRGFRKIRTGAIVATGVILLGLGFLAPTVSASEQDGVWVARTVAEVKADIQNIDNLSHYTIKWGDTLSAISGATGLSVDSLVEINRIANRDLIFANNKLYFSEEAFLKDGNTEVKRQRVSIDNSGSRQSYEVETKTDTVTGEQTTTVKQTSPVVVETPAVSASKSETSVSVAPKVEEPATPAPKVEEPATPAPKEEKPVTPAPKVEEPATPAPKEEKPATPAPKVEEPATPAPKAEEPATPTPNEEKPATPAPKEEKPATPAPKVEEPAAPAPKVEEPMVSEPKAEEPVSPAPKVEEPTVSEPKAEAPVATRPTTAETGKTSVAPSSDSEEVSTTTEETGESTSSDSNLVNSQENNSEVQDGTTNATSEEASESKEASTASEGGSTATQPAVEAGLGSEVATPGAPAAEGSSETTPGSTEEASGISAETTPERTVESESAPKENVTEAKETEKTGAEANSTPKENETEGTVSEVATPGATAETGTTEEGKDEATEESLDNPSTGNHSEDSGTPSTIPTDDSTATQPSDSTSSSVTPSEEAPVTSGDTNSTTQPAGETGNSETTAESSNTPSAEATNESGNAAESSPVTDDTTSNVETIEQPENSAPKEDKLPTNQNGDTSNPVDSKDETSNPAPKEGDSTSGEQGQPAEETPASTEEVAKEAEGTEPEAAKPTEPKVEAPTESSEASGTSVESTPEGTVESESTPKETGEEEKLAPKDEKAKKDLEDAQEEGRKTINDISTSKSVEIEKVKDETEKEKLKRQLEELKTEALEAIKNAKNHDAAVDATADYQTKIDEINVPGEELPAPNYDKDNLSTGRNDGTTIEGGSTAIGHGSGEAPSAATQPAPAEGADNSSVTTSSTQPATGTNSDSTGTAQPQPAVASPASSAQPTNESSASTGAATEPTSDSAPTVKPQPVATSETETSGTSSFRRAGEYRATARRVARSVNEPEGTINISYNYDGMPDIHGFFADPGENNTVTVTNSTTEDKVKELVKAKIQAKANELAKHGYKVKEEIVFEQDTDVKNFNYVVTFTKQTTGTTGFRIAPKVQVRAKKVAKRDLSNKTKQINIYYNLTALKDIAGALGELDGENMLTFSGETSKEELKRAVEEKTKAQIEKLKKQGFTVTSKTDLDQIVEGGDSYDYVVEFTKESKTQPVGTTGFRKAPLVQRRAKRSTEVKETVNVNIYFNLKTLPGIAGALDVDGETTIKLPKNATEAQVKAAIQEKIAKVESRGYKVSDSYFGAKTEKGYDYVVEFTKESKTQPVGTSGFRMAPAVQPRASRNRRSLEQPTPQKVKVNVFYNFDQMKDIAGFLGDINETSLEIAEGSTDDQVKAAVKNQVDAKKEELRKRGYTVKEDYLYKNNGKDYNYILTFSKTK